jgi:hypothetical protein
MSSSRFGMFFEDLGLATTTIKVKVFKCQICQVSTNLKINQSLKGKYISLIQKEKMFIHSKERVVIG